MYPTHYVGDAGWYSDTGEGAEGVWVWRGQRGDGCGAEDVWVLGVEGVWGQRGCGSGQCIPFSPVFSEPPPEILEMIRRKKALEEQASKSAVASISAEDQVTITTGVSKSPDPQVTITAGVSKSPDPQVTITAGAGKSPDPQVTITAGVSKSPDPQVTITAGASKSPDPQVTITPGVSHPNIVVQRTVDPLEQKQQLLREKAKREELEALRAKLKKLEL